MRPSYDLGIIRWDVRRGILFRSEFHLKLNVEVDGEVEWIRTEVACRIHSCGAGSRSRDQETHLPRS